MRDRKVGYSLVDFEDAMLATMIKCHELNLDDGETVDIHFSIVPALLGGRVDAVIGAFRNFDPVKLMLEGRKDKTFLGGGFWRLAA